MVNWPPRWMTATREVPEVCENPTPINQANEIKQVCVSVAADTVASEIEKRALVRFVCLQHADATSSVLVGPSADWLLPEVPRRLLRYDGNVDSERFLEEGLQFATDALSPESEIYPRA